MRNGFAREEEKGKEKKEKNGENSRLPERKLTAMPTARANINLPGSFNMVTSDHPQEGRWQVPG